LSWTFNRQPQFRAQPGNELCGWLYGLFTDVPGNYVKKALRECTGKEVCMEWLYHLGVPESQIEELAENSANTVPCMMPYITAFFMPRAAGDRPDVVPEGAVNFAFIGQFAETPRDTIFTTEYSMRTGMEAVYTRATSTRAKCGAARSTSREAERHHADQDGKPITDGDESLEKLALQGNRYQGATDLYGPLAEFSDPVRRRRRARARHRVGTPACMTS
ncbi:MAG: oleate hydratase, partial [Eggerthellaceae bacterium]